MGPSLIYGLLRVPTASGHGSFLMMLEVQQVNKFPKTNTHHRQNLYGPVPKLQCMGPDLQKA